MATPPKTLINSMAGIKAFIALLEKTPGSTDLVARRLDPAAVVAAVAGSIPHDDIVFEDLTGAALVPAIAGMTPQQRADAGLGVAPVAASAVPALAALRVLLTDGTYLTGVELQGLLGSTPATTPATASPSVTITSVSPSTAGSTATAEFQYTGGKPGNTITATLGGAALTLASVTVDNISSGSAATAAGAGRVTFVQPAAGTRNLVLTTTGTYAATSVPFSVVTSAAAAPPVGDGPYTFETVAAAQRSARDFDLATRVRRVSDGTLVTPDSLPTAQWKVAFGVSSSTTIPPNTSYPELRDAAGFYDTFWHFGSQNDRGSYPALPAGTWYPWAVTSDGAAHLMSSTGFVVPA